MFVSNRSYVKGKGFYIAGILFICLLIGQEVGATGGAFNSTKHGGGTTDGVAPHSAGNGSGVDRSVNPNYDTVTSYNDLSLEAGKYKPGDCSQCHEPHASFGESEPPPNDSGPHPYLALNDYGSSTNYSNLCWYCHQYFSNINGTGSPATMGKFRFYQGQNIYQDSSHYIDIGNNMFWPGDGTGSPIWPRKSRQFLAAGNRGSCVNCHTPHGIKATSSASAYDTTAVPASRQTTATNLSVSEDYLIPRQLIAWEEALCEGCHSALGPAIDIESEINKRHLSGSGHPIDDTSLAGRHFAGENTLVTTNKHVECYDCHNPHAVKTPSGIRGDGNAGRVEGMKYVELNGTERDPTMGGVRQPFVHDVCFKCHGDSFDCTMPYVAYGAETIQPGCIDGTPRHRGSEFIGTGYNNQKGASNKRKEFDSSTIVTAPHGGDGIQTNGSWHPVGLPGRNHSIQLCNQLATAFSLTCIDGNNDGIADGDPLGNLTINCTDCHNNDATGATIGPVTESSLRMSDVESKYLGIEPLGPHGSTKKRILRANYNTRIGTADSGNVVADARPGFALDGIPSNFALCFLCHDSTPFNNRLFVGNPTTCLESTNDINNCEWTNFYSTGIMNWNSSLHYYHLTALTYDGIPIKCHECHNNVHSNVEAVNTQYYKTGPSDGLITDGTHLVNFGPQTMPLNYAKPAFYKDAEGYFRCDLICHGTTMDSCSYLGEADGGPGHNSSVGNNVCF